MSWAFSLAGFQVIIIGRIWVIAEEMRRQLGFRSLLSDYDEKANYISLLRNCLLHNHGRVDRKLAACRPALKQGEQLSIGTSDVTEAVTDLRKFAYQIDITYESLLTNVGAAENSNDSDPANG